MVFFSENSIFYGSTLKNLTLTCCPNFFFLTPICIHIGSHQKIMGQKPMKNFSPEIQTQDMKELWKAFETLVHIRYGCTLKKLTLTFSSNFFPLPLYVYRKSLRNYGPKPNEFFFTVAPYFKVTPQMGHLKSGQNKDIWVYPENFFMGLWSHTYFLTSIYLESHRRIMDQKPN